MIPRAIRDGHGTAVASVAAANQNSFAVTFRGMAPKAWLGSYKIEGTVNGSPKDISVMALTDAFKDGMDIANYSLGALALTGPLDAGAGCGLPAGTPRPPLRPRQPSLSAASPAAVSFSGFDDAMADSIYWFQYTAAVTIPAGLPAGNQPVVLSIGGVNSTAVPGPVKIGEADLQPLN